MSSSKHKLHAIQLESLSVVELFIRCNMHASSSYRIEDRQFSLTTGYSQYEAENQSIAVKLSATIGKGNSIDSDEANNKETPFDLFVEIAGVFVVDDSKFNLSVIDKWAARNAPLIIYPYLRENVYSLTSRAGFTGVILPLFEVPTIKMQAPAVIQNQ